MEANIFKYRINAKIDENQKAIVKDLRKLGISVEVNHDDILCGYKGKTYWFEIKVNAKSPLKPKQLKLLDEFKGHYSIVWTLEQILDEMGVLK